jgi:Mrp family chromosome partitioning ATPase
MIGDATVIVEALREALTSAVEPSSDLQGYRRRPLESLDQPSLEPEFVERCRLALAKMVALEDEGVIAVCSARRGEGRSSVAAALALSLARSRAHGRVLLLDLDFGHARQAELLSVANKPGLADFLEGRERRLRLIAGGPNRQLWLLPAGEHLGDRVRLFHTLSSEATLSVLRERFQWIVVDLPPLVGHLEASPLARAVDWRVVVGRHRRTTLADLRECADLLGDERPTGFLLTHDSNRIPGWIRRRL